MTNGRGTASRRRSDQAISVATEVLDAPQSTLLDVLDELLNRGVLADGDVMLGLAGVDLIYLRLSALLCGADRVLPKERHEADRKARRRGTKKTRTR